MTLSNVLGTIIDICVLIPALICVVKCVRDVVRNKNWNTLVKLVASLMTEAERLYENGADKKAWVMAEVAAAACTLNCDVNMDVVSDLIDKLCDMSRIVNGPEAKPPEAEA